MHTIEKHMDLLTKDDLRILLQKQQEPIISLFMPTRRDVPAGEQNPIRFKNLVAQAREELLQRDIGSRQMDELMAPIQPILENDAPDFWRYVSDGLAVFLAEDLYVTYRLPHAFDEFVFVGNLPHVRQLLPLLADHTPFYVLALNQKNARLFRGNRYQIGEVHLDDVPNSLAEVLRYDDFERQLQFHSSTPNVQTEHDAAFHGQGSAADEATQKETIQRFLRALDSGVCDYLNTENAPLVLAGVPTLRGLYHRVNHYNNLLDQDINSDPQSLSHTELHQRAWTLVQPHLDHAFDDDAAEFKRLAGSGDPRAANELEQIVPAAYYKRVESLFLTADETRWGLYDTEGDTVVLHEQHQVGDGDLLNAAAVHTLLNGGRVHTANREQIPGGEVVAALLRY